ncbi:MAG: hypothetical protein ACRDM7_10235 [Thermoleophilaceae bacterium]
MEITGRVNAWLVEKADPRPGQTFLEIAAGTGDMLSRMAGSLARAISALPDDEREATRLAIMENAAPYRNDDGSYSAPAATCGVLVR